MSIKVGSDFSGVGVFDLASEINFLLGCEESQAVCIELRKLGFNAFSCDLQQCSGGHPEWHFNDDIFKVIKGGELITESGETVFIDKWHCMIAFPPCTHLAVSGAAWFEQKRKDGRQQQGIDFFMAMVNTDIEMAAIENPVGIMSKLYKKPSQVIQPYYFGDEAQKTTCLWLKNLPHLYHNSKPNLFDSEITHSGKGEFYEWVDGKSGKTKKQPKWYAEAFMYGKEHGKERSKTFPGIARAMAEQWGEYAVKRISADN
mgnify:CR=1 FL=1